MRDVLSITDKMGIPFEQALQYHRGERSFKYDGAGGIPAPRSRGTVVLDGKDDRYDPAAATPAQMEAAIRNPLPQGLLNGKPVNPPVYRIQSREELEEVEGRLKVRRARGENVHFADCLEEYIREKGRQQS